MKKYGMRLREYGPGCQPAGVKKFEYTNKKETGYWSYIWYEEELPKEKADQYDLDLLKEE